MPLKYIDPSGAIITQPMATVSYKVQNINSSLATSGVMTLVGEANGGPSFDQEAAGGIEKNFFGPGQLSAVIAKYGSGDIVDAFNQLIIPSKDTDIQGSPASIFIIKTNKGAQASANLVRVGQSAYVKIADMSFGRLGNSISTTISAANAEVAPTTGAFTYIAAPQIVSNTQVWGFRVNSGAAITSTLSTTTGLNPTSLESPTAFVTRVSTLFNTATQSGVMATGGLDRGVITGLTGTSSLAVTVAGNVATFTLSGAAVSWATIPSAGDTLVVPNLNDYSTGTASVIKGAGNANCGSYIVQSASALSITAKKVANDLAAVLVAPVAVTAQAIVTAARELRCFSPVVMQNMTGIDRGVLPASAGPSVTATASGQTLSLVSGTAWVTQPVIGDIAFVPTASSMTGASNGGWYSVTASAPTTMTLTRLSNSTTLATVTATLVSTDLQVYRSVIDGVGKTLSVFDAGVTTLGTYQSVIASLWTGSAATPVTWLTSLTQGPLTSSVEQSILMKDVRASTNQSESLTIGGNVVLLVGYNGTTATMTVTSTNTLSTTVTGGVGGSLTAINFADFKTLADIASFINSQPGYTASVALASFRTLPGWALDQGTFNICSSVAGVTPGRIKKDAYEFLNAVDNSVLVQTFDVTTGFPIVLGGTLAGASGNFTTALSGLPDAQATTYLAGGTLGSTSDANVVAAFKACEKIRTNFVVPLFSRDASKDILDGATDSGSTYTITGINTALNNHCLLMSGLSQRRNRQGFASIKDTFANAQTAAQQISSARVCMNFMDVVTAGVNGSIQQFQPWMGAVEEAAMQAAGFYKPVFNKLLNINGAVQAAGDFSYNSQDNVNSALNAGLTVIGPDDTGVNWKFLADYTTYQADLNFVFNSVQAVYVADLIALSTARELERQFLGKSLAQISASMMLSVLAGIMKNFMRLNLITSSDGAPAGYIDASVSISGPVASVKFKVFEATGLYFIPIEFLIAQVQQSANQ
jgi:hypothetical protein